MSKNMTEKENTEYLQVTQIKSTINRNKSQKLVLIGLGLRGLNKTVKVRNTPSFLGMINKIKHLLKVETLSN
jgi:large subunit ribosomal protein L30